MFVLLPTVSRKPAGGGSDVCMFVHPDGLFARRSIESAGGGRLCGEVMEEEALITGLSSLRRSPPAPLA